MASIIDLLPINVEREFWLVHEYHVAFRQVGSRVDQSSDLPFASMTTYQAGLGCRHYCLIPKLRNRAAFPESRIAASCFPSRKSFTA